MLVKNSYALLKKVLMHRPGDEINLVTEKTAKNFNFAGPVNPDRFLFEYDRFLDCLKKCGVEPVLIGEVLKDDAEAKAYISRRPNVLYTRDLAVMVGKGIVLMSMNDKGRKWDPWLVRRVAEKLNIPVTGEIGPEGVLEGGGVEFLTDGVLVAGLCDRANEVALEKLKDLVLGTGVNEFIAVMLPEGVIHIDGVFAPLDKNLAIIVKNAIDFYPSCVHKKNARPRYTLFGDYLKEKNVETIEITCEEGQRGAANYVQVGARKFVGYEGNSRVEKEIEKRGGTVITFPGRELLKGKGGPHCMTCPLDRKYY